MISIWSTGETSISQSKTVSNLISVLSPAERKNCEPMGDILQWDQSNKNYILTHDVSGVDWRF